MAQADPIDGAELELICLCGYENFQRVIVQRKPNPPIVTDFVACVGCLAMYYAPAAAVPVDPALERDAAIAARDYVKPGRSKR